ncbi:hypothetical protein B0H12DRAFT_1244840 [Mycena haematopus]|nr:hypothetical protein B0H12DRAFT_1244840 [Mycena haematopus]
MIQIDVAPALRQTPSAQETLFTQSPAAENGSVVAGMPLIPPEHSYRTLVLCFDGTGDQFDLDNSNIVQFFSMLPKADRTKQMVYYQAGIGTYTTPEIATPFISKMSKISTPHLRSVCTRTLWVWGYEFLMQNYLLDDVQIEFIGVWDTVNSVGLVPKRLPFTTSNTIVRTFRHAVSLDERRTKFKPNLWNRPNEKEKLLSISDQKNHDHAKAPHPRKNWSQEMMESTYDGAPNPTRPTDVEEVFFAGCHCDVGGGSVANDTKYNLARIPLRWMVRECFKANSGIMFDTEGLRSIGLDPESLYPTVMPRPAALPVGTARIQSIPRSQLVPLNSAASDSEMVSLNSEVRVLTEEEIELRDALSPIYDQLSRHRLWWILEVVPLRQRYQLVDDTWNTSFSCNLGRGRKIPKDRDVRVHRSVKTRMEAQTEHGGKYIPAATVDLGRAIWVD